MTVTKIPVGVNDRELNLISYGSVGNGDITIHINNLVTGDRELAWLNKASSDALIEALTKHFGAPKPVTFQSQFAELAVGDQFTATEGSLVVKAVKVDSLTYFCYDTKLLVPARRISSDSTITKN